MSQFKIFQSTDAGAPALNGLTGSLLSVLNYCLYSGSGWTKPLPDSASIGGVLPSVGVFKQGTGSMLYLGINDGGPGAGGGLEARICGWESITSITQSTSAFTGSNSFPTIAQGAALSLNGPFVIARKSKTADNVSRAWACFTDSSSMYFFAKTTDTTDVYYGFMFGDIYATGSDLYKCMIIGRAGENSGTQANDKLDQLTVLATATPTHYIARTYTGTGTSYAVGKHGDATKGSAATLLGTTQYPNGPDGGLYLSPVWVCESANANIRGTMRGFYHVCHPVATFVDGQMFSGSGDYVGKIFQMVKYSGNSGIYCMEISNTVN